MWYFTIQVLKGVNVSFMILCLGMILPVQLHCFFCKLCPNVCLLLKLEEEKYGHSMSDDDIFHLHTVNLEEIHLRGVKLAMSLSIK